MEKAHFYQSHRDTKILLAFSFVVPPAPSGVTGQATGMTSIRVTWTDFSSSLNTMNITGFGVTYREAMNSSQSWMLVGAPASSSEILLEDLKIFTTYTIRVMAFISTGSGLPSDLFDVKTSEGGKCF